MAPYGPRRGFAPSNGVQQPGDAADAAKRRAAAGGRVSRCEMTSSGPQRRLPRPTRSGCAPAEGLFGEPRRGDARPRASGCATCSPRPRPDPKRAAVFAHFRGALVDDRAVRLSGSDLGLGLHGLVSMVGCTAPPSNRSSKSSGRLVFGLHLVPRRTGRDLIKAERIRPPIARSSDEAFPG